jgi:alpha-ketoglutarate-dependent taurine dioxygenase
VGNIDVKNGSLFRVIENVHEDELLDVCGRFGNIIPHRGVDIYEVRPSPAHTGLYSALSHGDLHPHLDKYEWREPPDTVGLFCKRRDREDRGATLVCDMRPLLCSMSSEDLHLLRTFPVSFVADQGLRSKGDTSALEAPILDEADPWRPRLRYSYNYTLFRRPHPRIEYLRSCIHAYFAMQNSRILLKPGELLLIRNTLALHAREAFDDPDRLLLRIYLRDHNGRPVEP